MTTAPETVRDLIARQLAQRPDAVYGRDADGMQVIRFGDLATSGLAVEALLRSHGSRPGDTVSLVMPNGQGPCACCWVPWLQAGA